MVGLVEEGSNGGGTGLYYCQRTRERSGDGKGKTERRDRETREAEWKPRPNLCERTDACVRVFPFLIHATFTFFTVILSWMW
jgi:hypothetical protein